MVQIMNFLIVHFISVIRYKIGTATCSRLNSTLISLVRIPAPSIKPVTRNLAE
jgi:hypothetical protein